MAELDKDRIAAAALAVADRRGVAGFTMRAVAAFLKVTPMALYHHVENKAGLVALLADATIQKYPPPPTGEWQNDLWAMARWMRQTKLAHPAVAQLRRAYQVWTPDILDMTEHWLSLWLQERTRNGQGGYGSHDE